MTIDQLLEAGFKLPDPTDAIHSVVLVGDHVVITTRRYVYKAEDDYRGPNGFVVRMVCPI